MAACYSLTKDKDADFIFSHSKGPSSKRIEVTKNPGLPTCSFQRDVDNDRAVVRAGAICENEYVEAVLDSVPVVYWPLDDGVSTLDERVTDLDGALTGGSWTTTCLVNDEGSAFAPDLSTDGLITIPVSALLDDLWGSQVSGKDATIEFIWSGSGVGTLFDKRSAASLTSGWSIAHINSRTWRFAWETTGIAYTSTGGIVYSPLPADNTCWHVAFRFNAEERANTSYVSWVINGNEDDPPSISAGSGNLTVDPGESLLMGNNAQSSSQATGKLMHVAIYDRIVPASELCSHFQASGIVDSPGGPGACT